MDTPVQNPNENLQSRAERLRAKAQRARKQLLMKAKVERGKAKTYKDLSHIEKLKEQSMRSDVQTKTACVTKDNVINFLRNL